MNYEADGGNDKGELRAKRLATITCQAGKGGNTGIGVVEARVEHRTPDHGRHSRGEGGTREIPLMADKQNSPPERGGGSW